jgi:hypothetical protein
VEAAIRLRYLLPILCWSLAVAQTARDDWKSSQNRFDLKAHLTDSLADAPLTAAERAEIYRVVDGKTIHDSFLENERDKERQTVLSSRVGRIELGSDHSEQIFVRGPDLFCGATGNCSIWIFARDNGHLRLILETGGGLFIVKATETQGFHDVATGMHMSAFEEGFAVYRWNGEKYTQIDCYYTRLDPKDDRTPPVISNCDH